ncbi:MAG TPA: DEAD/DEAH box helicase [Pseudoxanthomonas sp.]|nr:DEAD/DEAH box helicase [Pseudoxanthomonas sp.]
MPFSSLGLSPELLPFFQSALDEANYTAPTPIQAQTIPVILQGHDVLGRAQTGSGKTAAFVLPLLQQFAQTSPTPPRRVRSLILVPTRELAAQVGETFICLAEYLPRRIKVAVVFGGISINPQMIDLRWGADIVVATPGRLLDLVDNNALSLAHVSTLVLDEADRLLDLGFGEELHRVLALLPAKRQTLLFSATFPSAIEALANALLQSPLRIEVETTALAAPDIRQRAIEVDSGQRTQLLRHLIQQEGWNRALVFVATKHAAEVVADKLCKAGIQAEALHGELSQGRRTRVLQAFKQASVQEQEHVQVLVATDVAARGIDIAQLPVVVNYDLPRSTTDYTHRIGRTGRAGESGMAISFVSAGTESHFRLIEKRARLRVSRERVAGFEPVEVLAPNPADPSETGGIKGTRPSKKDKLRAAAALEKAKATPPDAD